MFIATSNKGKVIYSLLSNYFKKAKTAQYILKGGSMQPIFRSGVLATITAKHGDFKLGDVVMYGKNKKIIVHRIVALRERAGKTEYLLKGDANLHYDGWVPAQDVFGLVTMISYAGRPGLNLTTKKATTLNYLMAHWSKLLVRHNWLLSLHRLIYHHNLAKVAKRFYT